MRRLLKLLTSKALIVAVLIVLQLVALSLSIYYLASFYAFVSTLLTILSIIISIYVINRPGNSSYKIAWIILIMLFPLFGGIFYLLFGNKKMSRKVVAENLELTKKTVGYTIKNSNSMRLLKERDCIAYKQALYLENCTGYSLYKNCYAKYLRVGEVYFECLLEELRKAERYIFMEYFILESGIFLNSVLDILEEKVSHGVEVYVIYDDAGCVAKVPYKFDEVLRKKGIHAVPFNLLEPRLLIRMNNRDHRKICVIDGMVAFTGGINIADEYINAKVVFGHWLDSGIVLKGEVAWGFALMFIQFYNLSSKDRIINYEKYRGFYEEYDEKGFMIPYNDSPLDEESIGENLHISIISMAQKYVYIKTPYLICDNEILLSLMNASKMGIDVQIMLPHIPDKWYVHVVTRAYYRPLLEAGVKILEYKKGFLHAKEFISDDKVGVIGSTNMDYRSYYLHHECGVWLYDCDAIFDMKNEFIRNRLDCVVMDVSYLDKENYLTKLVRSILRLLAPIM